MEDHEKHLIQRFRDGDQSAFKEFVEKYQQPLFRLAMDLTGEWDEAEDLSQEVFIKAYHALPGFRGTAKVISWLYRIMMNTYIDSYRRKASRNEWGVTKRGDREQTSVLDTLATSDPHHNPVRQTTSRQIQEDINQALKALAPQQRSVFILRHYHDLSQKEIARIMGLSVGTVKSQLFRAIRRLQSELSFYRPELGLRGES